MDSPSSYCSSSTCDSPSSLRDLPTSPSSIDARFPDEIAIAIPDFVNCGPRNCINTLDACFDNEHPEEEGDSLSACSRCVKPCSKAALHGLPCGHALCRYCVEARVDCVAQLVHLNFAAINERLLAIEKGLPSPWHRAVYIGAGLPRCQPQDAVFHCEPAYLNPAGEELAAKGCHGSQQPLSALSELPRQILFQLPTRPPPSFWPPGMYEHYLLAEALELGGFTCCGQDMQLGRFQRCMPQTTAKRYWLMVSWVRTAPRQRLRCAWPDCGAFIPDSMISGGPNVDKLRVHCAVCSGNSAFFTTRVVEATEPQWPGLQAGKYILSPAL